MLRQVRHVVQPFAERRHRDLDHPQAVVEVLAETGVADHLLEVAVRGGDDPRLGALRPLAAHRVVLVVLQHAQQLALKLERRVADLVEEDRAAARQREAAAVVGHRAGEGALHVPEQLRLQQRRRERRAVDRDERLRRVGRVEVDRPRDHLFARPRFAADQNVGAVGGQLADQLVDVDHPRIVTYQLVQLVGARLFFGGAPRPLPRASVLEHLGQHAPQVVQVERLDQEVVRAFAHRRHHRRHVVVGRHQDDVDRRRALAEQLQQREAVESGHPHIGNHDVGQALIYYGERALGILGGAHFGDVVGQRLGERLADRGVVVDDQDVSHWGIVISGRVVALTAQQPAATP